MKKFFLFIALTLLLIRCGSGLIIKKHIIYNYYLAAADNEDQLSLCYHGPMDGGGYGGIIEQTVFAVGYNNNYIIAKQHPTQMGSQPNKKNTNYYILPIKDGNDSLSNLKLQGPLTLEEFEQKRKELNIDSIQFTIVYKDLE